MNSWWNHEHDTILKRNAYFITIVLVALSSIIRIWPLHMLGPYNPYLTYYPAVIIAAVIGGFFAGILATTLTCLIISLLWWLLVNEPFIKVHADWLAMMLFAFNGTLISGISEKMRRANERTKSEHKRLEFALNASRQGFWNLNLKTRLAERSLLHDQIFGYATPLSEWTYEMFLNHVHPDDACFVDQTVKTALANNTSFEFQCRIYRAYDKRVRWISVSGEATKNHKKNHMLGLVQDITQRKKEELALRSLTSKYNALLKATPDCLIISNKEGQIIFSNKVAEHIFGYTAKEMIGQKIEFLIPMRYLKQHENYRQHYFEKPCLRPMGTGLDLYGKHKDGHEFSVEISLSPIETEDGLLVLATVRDITERKKTEDAKAMLLALVESSDEAIIGNDLKGNILSWNKAAEVLYGYTEAEMIGYCIKKLFPADKQEEFDYIIQQIIHGEHIKHKESIRVHKDGHMIPVSVTISPIKNAKGDVVGVSTTARDITQQKLIEEKLKHLAEHDPLTGLINRAFFEDRIEQAILLSKRQKSTMAVCFLDLDDFKHINDHYGHATGDLLLCAASERIKSCLRDSDTLARLGGDEFALIALSLKKEQDIIKIAEKMVQCFSAGFLIENKTLNVTLSIGISLYPKDGDQALIEKADAAMYYVKTHGKNNFKLFDASLPLGGRSRSPSA